MQFSLWPSFANHHNLEHFQAARVLIKSRQMSLAFFKSKSGGRRIAQGLLSGNSHRRSLYNPSCIHPRTHTLSSTDSVSLTRSTATTAMDTDATDATATAPFFGSAESTKKMQDYCKRILSENAAAQGELESATDSILSMHNPDTSAESLKDLSTHVDATVKNAFQKLRKVGDLISLAFFNSNYTEREDTVDFAKSIEDVAEFSEQELNARGKEITKTELFKTCDDVLTGAGIRTDVYKTRNPPPERHDLGKPIEHVNLMFAAGMVLSDVEVGKVQSKVDQTIGENEEWSITILPQFEFYGPADGCDCGDASHHG